MLRDSKGRNSGCSEAEIVHGAKKSHFGPAFVDYVDREGCTNFTGRRLRRMEPLNRDRASDALRPPPRRDFGLIPRNPAYFQNFHVLVRYQLHFVTYKILLSDSICLSS